MSDLSGLTITTNRRLGANPGLAQGVLYRAEYLATQADPGIARLQYGNAIERMFAQQIRETPVISNLYKHVGGPNNPDFVGRSIFSGLQFDITTPGSINSHLSRPYGQGLILLLYSRPTNFTVLP